MKALNSLFSVLLASLVALYAIACSGNAQNPSKINVDEDIIVAIYPTIDNGDTVEAISPCLLEDTVHVSELIHYPGDDGITIPFNLSDTTKYAEITERNIEKRIAISINGRVVSTPVVKMKIANGACSVILPKSQISTIFPTITLTALK
ncbi:hypothetical protein [uncultured Muribaculum sp.]|uniref:SecDF P1 head subdomain-containing protein n=1 Tax=uncultured Muribaculum sp. TaxID=1918613 RepID=UPI00260812E7|nr:hypothetical protein [uncultured Muribaculum sp.]